MDVKIFLATSKIVLITTAVGETFTFCTSWLAVAIKVQNYQQLFLHPLRKKLMILPTAKMKNT